MSVCVCLCYKMRAAQRATPVQNFPVGVPELLADAGGRHTVIAERRCQLLHVRVNTSVCHCTHTHTHVVVKTPPSKMRRKMRLRRTLTPTLVQRGAAQGLETPTQNPPTRVHGANLAEKHVRFTSGSNKGQL